MQIVFLFAFVIFVFVAVVMYFVWRRFRGEGAFLYWSASALLQGLGWGLLFVSAAGPRTFVVISVSETLLFAGHFTSFLAMAFLLRERASKPWLLAGGALAALFLILDLECRTLHFRPWDGVVALSHSVINVMIVLALLKDRRPENAGVVYSVSAVYVLLVSAALKKSFDVLTGAGDAVEITSEAGTNLAVVLGATTTIVVGTVGLALLAFTRSAQRLSVLATQDALTLLMNRRAWDATIDKECKRIARSGSTFSVILLDFDHFKDVNDHYGHAAGDETLRVMARVIASQLRAVDTLSRFGGEEFVVLLVGARAADTARVAERIRLSVAATPIEFQGGKFSITCSAGVAEYDRASDTADSVVAKADHAMYRAKGEGRNRVTVAEG
jgi:diguanylate cyclase (GGDEF)-like protein